MAVFKHRIAGWPILMICTVGLLLTSLSVSSWAAGGGGSSHHASATRAAPRCKTYKLGRKKVRVCNGTNGKNGAPGPGGPQGAPGASGAPGRGVPFSFALNTNTPLATVFNQNGVKIEAGCTNGALQLDVRPQDGDHSIVEVTTFDNDEGGVPRAVSIPDAEVNVPIDMLVGDSGLRDYNGLLAVRTLSGEMTTFQWWAMGSSNTPQGDCVGGGTASPA